ncbi:MULTISPECIES: thiol reductant ABC exporter subunit CydC [Oceanobacillus]|uniref:Thiol reductant ABC exporter subunit CydC n=1 Tax=Oceanobacillus indicireducens TaxID=1004261 RepID=A0A918CZ57_9BACI|nr:MULTISPECIES: thiol reductant ABC exporter subunit CydC [Oceanobacillus]GGN51274.1 thiol reductant ABC exporter subunit CydC [Oceanobacillus indicireducens]
MRDLTTVIHLLFKEKKDIILSIICGFIGGITAVGLFSASGYLISQAALAPPIYTLMVLVGTVKLFGIISAISRYGERYYSHRGTFTMLSNLRVSFYERLEPLAPQIFQKFRSGDLLARIVGDVETLQNFFLRVFYPPIVLFLVFFCTIFFTAYFSTTHAIIIFVGFLLTTVLVPVYFAIRQRRVDQGLREERGKLSTEVTELFYGFRDLKIYQRLEEKEEALEQMAETYVREQEKAGVHHLYSESLNTFVSLIISVVVLGMGAYLIAAGSLNGVFLAMLLMISLTVFEDTTSMAIFPSHLEDNRRAAARLSAVVGSEPVEVEEKEDLILTSSPAITFNDVSFTYSEEERQTLNDVQLYFPAGSKTAIVGPSGSGKSTILSLLLNFNSADSGEILINGEEISGLNQESIWKYANVVLQENHFFFGTIRDNLKIAADEVSDEHLLKVLEKVELSQFKLDDAVLEKGANLSGGEKQRLALARTMLKNSYLWLLDEPTSSMDSLTSFNIYQELFELAKHDTLILISHRLNGLETMDQIVVMEEGKVVEVGSYEQLLEMQGYFYELKQIEQSVFHA